MMNYKARHKARIFAMQALYQWAHTQEDFAALSSQFRERNDYHKYVDWEWFEHLLNGVILEINTLDELITVGAQRGLKEINPVELSLLRVAVFELKDCLEVPYQVVISEYVDISGEFGSSEAYQFVNATLEQLAKKLRQLEYQGEQNVTVRAKTAT
jgi:N utilization substance protein B